MTKNDEYGLTLPFELLSLQMVAKQIGCPKEALDYYFEQLRDEEKATNLVHPFEMQVRTKKRKLYNTEVPLKKVIKNINRMLSKISLPPEFNGSVKDKSIKDNASPHVGNSYLTKIDVKKFFPSIKKNEIKKIFIKVGCSPAVANVLTRIVSFDKHIPQGYPTSSAIGNLFMTMFCYQKIKEICGKNNYVFSIWVDDIAISSKTPINEAHLQETIRAIESSGLKVHRKRKLKRLGPSKRKLVTGIITNEKLNLPKKWIRELDLKLHLASTNGLADLATGRCSEKYEKSVKKSRSKNQKPRPPEQWAKDHVAGLLYFAKHINIDRFNKISSKHEETIKKLSIIKLSS